MTTVTVRLWSAVADAAGHQHGAEVSVPARCVGDLLQTLIDRHGDPFTTVLGTCSILVDGLVVAPRSPRAGEALTHGATIDLMPPFAGG